MQADHGAALWPKLVKMPGAPLEGRLRNAA
jgi:hypothetical protein